MAERRWRTPDPEERQQPTVAPHQNLLAPTPCPDDDDEEPGVPEPQGAEWKADFIERWQRGELTNRGDQS